MRYKLGDVARFIDYRGKTPPKTTHGIPLVTAKIVKDNIIQSPTEYIAVDFYNEWMRRGIPQKGDVVFTTEAPLGEVAQIKTAEKLAFAQRIIIMQGEKDRLDNDFLFYSLQYTPMRERIQARSTGTTVVGIKAAELRRVEIDLPDIATQRNIAATLRSLDDKIENNSKINHHLEQIAQAIYADFIVSVDGQLIKLKEICALQEGYVNPSQSRAEYFDGDIKWLRAVDINESFIFDTSRTLTRAGFESAGKSAYLFKPNTIAISKSGTIGRLGFVADFMCGNRAVINIAPKDARILPFLYLYLKSRQAEYPELAVGSVQKNLYVPILQELDVLVPEESVLLGFCNSVAPLFVQWKNNVAENRTLSQTRDTLLPRLMSGELSVADLSR